jgi:hypothetical protein
MLGRRNAKETLKGGGRGTGVRAVSRTKLGTKKVVGLGEEWRGIEMLLWVCVP